PLKLWEETWEVLSEDILYKKRKLFRYPDLQLSTEQIQNYCLVEIKESLNRNGRSLTEFQDLPRPNSQFLTNMDNRLIREALDFDMNKSGTGKTFLYKTIISRLRSEKKIVLAVASSDHQKVHNEGKELLRSIASRINKMTGKGDVGASLPRTLVRGSQNPNSELDYARVSEVPIIDHMDALRPEGSSWLINETNVETLFGVKFTSQSDIEKFEVDVSNSSLLVSSSTIINVPRKLNSIDVAATFGVPLSTIGGLQKLINDIEAGKHDELLSGMTNDDHMETLDALGSICNSIQANRNNAYVIPCKVSHEDDSINLNVDESTIPSDPIVKSMGINTKSTSYAGDASASAKEQRKVNSNFRTLVADLIFDGVNVFILCKVVRKEQLGETYAKKDYDEFQRLLFL
nr:ATP-dependent DNA helicase PIF2 [Tanacetum cinerariifolium]